MKEKVLISDDDGDIHYLNEGEPFLGAKFSLCGKRLHPIYTTRVKDKHPVSCVKCTEAIIRQEAIDKQRLSSWYQMFPIRNYQKNIIHSLILELRDAGLESVDRHEVDKLSFNEANRLIWSLCRKRGESVPKISFNELRDKERHHVLERENGR